SVPVVLLSDLDDENLTVQAIRQGAQDYLVKGRVNADQLVRSLRCAIERQRLEEERHEARKLQAVGQLAAGVAHGFNNLLTGILGYTELLLDSPPSTEFSQRDLVEIRQCAERAAELTQQLLAFGRKQILRLQVLDLNHLIDGMQEPLRHIL